MWQGLPSAVLAAAVLGGAAAPAGAETLCVDPARAECLSPAAAFAAAQDGDRIVLAALEDDAPLASAHAIEVIGAGAGATALGALELSDPGAAVADVRTASLDLAGTATRVRVVGPVRLRGRAALRAAEVDGPVALAGSGAAASLHSVLVRVTEGTALTACDGALAARHVTVAGEGDGAAAACPGATLELSDAIVAGTFAAPLDGPVGAASTVLGGPGLVDAEGRLPAG